MKNKDVLVVIKQLEIITSEGKRLVKDGHPDAEVPGQHDTDRALLWFLEFVWGMRPIPRMTYDA